VGAPLLLYLHGIGQQPAADALKAHWDLAVAGRELGAQSAMVYWADLLHAAPPRRTRGQTTARADEQAFAAALMQRLTGHPAPPNAPRAKVLPLPPALRKPITQLFLTAFVADAAAYFYRPELRRAVQQRLRAALAAAKGRPVTLVAHSLGSVIAYEVLATLKAADVNLTALVTLGSPLGVAEIQDLLEPADGRIPAVVRRWHNFADPADPVALAPQLATDFHGSHTDISDELLIASDTRWLWGFSAHAAAGYLAQPQVRAVVTDAMRMDPMARFVVARDVAERLAAVPTARHPVLIEVLEPGYPALGAEADATPEVPQATRIAQAAASLAALVDDPQAARIDPLRRFVAAHLTAAEIERVAAAHHDLRVYAVWASSRKRKLTDTAVRAATKVDAASTSFGARGAGICWAVLDTGVQADHPHFKGRIEAVWDCTEPGPPQRITQAKDPDGHGTQVAGLITGQSSEGDGARHQGLAPEARVVVYKVLRDDGVGEDAWIIKALDHIAARNAGRAGSLAVHGVNLSLGGGFDHTVYGCGFSPICTELRRLWRNGVLVVVACGNEGKLRVVTPDGDVEVNATMSVGDPANLEECIAVGSVHTQRPHLYGVSPFSSRGPTADGRAKPDVVAPGERVPSCNAAWRGGQPHYREASGTSLAAPQVSGLLAAFLSARPEFQGRPDEVKALLLATCSDLGRDRYHQGRGLPNLMAMLLA